ADAGLVRSAGRAVARHAVTFALAAATSIVAVAAQTESGAMLSSADLPAKSRLALYFYGTVFYALKTVLPFGLAPLHRGQIQVSWDLEPFVWWTAAAGLVLAVVVLAIAWRRLPRSLGFLCIFVAYLAMVAPVGGLGQSGPQIAGERYAYQPGWVLT